MLVDKVTPKQIFEVLKDQATYPNWFTKCLSSKVHSTEADGNKLYSTVFKGAYPLNSREIIHRTLTNSDDTN
jgi:ribosome-associated toxin RatA of RatAB toxin-antitoxin module